RQRDYGAERHHERDLVFVTPPGHVDDAGIVGEPRQTQSGDRQRREKDQQANHSDSALNARRMDASRPAGSPNLTVLDRPRALRSPLRGLTAAPSRPPVSRAPAPASRPPPDARPRAAC